MKELIQARAKECEANYRQNARFKRMMPSQLDKELDIYSFETWLENLKQLESNRPELESEIMQEIASEYYNKDNENQFNDLVTKYLVSIAPENSYRSAERTLELITNNLFVIFEYIGFNDFINDVSKKVMKAAPSTHL